MRTARTEDEQGSGCIIVVVTKGRSLPACHAKVRRAFDVGLVARVLEIYPASPSDTSLWNDDPHPCEGSIIPDCAFTLAARLAVYAEDVAVLKRATRTYAVRRCLFCYRIPFEKGPRVFRCGEESKGLR